MDTIIAAVIGVLVPSALGFVAWLINKLVLAPLADLQKQQQTIVNQLAVRDHLLTQMILRIEHIEEVVPHPRRHIDLRDKD